MNLYYEKLKEEFMKNKDIFIIDGKLSALGIIFIVSALIKYLDIKEL